MEDISLGKLVHLLIIKREFNRHRRKVQVIPRK